MWLVEGCGLRDRDCGIWSVGVVECQVVVVIWAAADIIKASEPAVTPVICHVTVVVPAPECPRLMLDC